MWKLSTVQNVMCLFLDPDYEADCPGISVTAHGWNDVVYSMLSHTLSIEIFAISSGLPTQNSA